MAEADKSRKQRQQTLLQGILSDEEDDDTLPDGTAAPLGSMSRKKSKTILQSLREQAA